MALLYTIIHNVHPLQIFIFALLLSYIKEQYDET